MTNYRTYQAYAVSASMTASCGFPGADAGKTAWGVMRGTSAEGTILFQSGSIPASDLVEGQPFPCYPGHVTCTAGTIYILG